jgi:hypothetical protein
MRTKPVVSAASFNDLFEQFIPKGLINTALARCGLRHRCPPVVLTDELIKSLLWLST